jgi:hypothetical protein
LPLVDWCVGGVLLSHTWSPTWYLGVSRCWTHDCCTCCISSCALRHASSYCSRHVITQGNRLIAPLNPISTWVISHQNCETETRALIRSSNYCAQTLPGVSIAPNRLGAHLPKIRDIVPATDSIVLIVRPVRGDMPWRCSVGYPAAYRVLG